MIIGIILAVGVLLLLVQGRVVNSLFLQLLLLVNYGLLGMGWILIRVRQGAGPLRTRAVRSAWRKQE